MMTKSIVSSKGYLIQKRAFKNNSLIVTLFSEKGELISGIIYQGQKKKLVLFQQYYISLYEREGLSLISKLEALEPAYSLNGEALFCALYVNEIIGRLAKGLSDSAEVYEAYQNTLQSLSQCSELEFEYFLRHFELIFLKSLGYGLDFQTDSQGSPIQAMKSYVFKLGEGFIETYDNSTQQLSLTKGSNILLLAQQPLSNIETQKVAKWLNRQIFNELLEGKALVSRQLFSQASL